MTQAQKRRAEREAKKRKQSRRTANHRCGRKHKNCFVKRKYCTRR